MLLLLGCFAGAAGAATLHEQRLSAPPRVVVRARRRGRSLLLLRKRKRAKAASSNAPNAQPNLSSHQH